MALTDSVGGVLLALLGGALVLMLGRTLFYPSAVLRWLDGIRYWYEVTLPLSMMTSTEKFIFNSFLFLFFSMIIIATLLYLPEHILHVTGRAYYYMAGVDSQSGLRNISWNLRYLFSK